MMKKGDILKLRDLREQREKHKSAHPKSKILHTLYFIIQPFPT